MRAVFHSSNKKNSIIFTFRSVGDYTWTSATKQVQYDTHIVNIQTHFVSGIATSIRLDSPGIESLPIPLAARFMA